MMLYGEMKMPNNIERENFCSCCYCTDSSNQLYLDRSIGQSFMAAVANLVRSLTCDIVVVDLLAEHKVFSDAIAKEGYKTFTTCDDCYCENTFGFWLLCDNTFLIPGEISEIWDALVVTATIPPTMYIHSKKSLHHIITREQAVLRMASMLVVGHKLKRVSHGVNGFWFI